MSDDDSKQAETPTDRRSADIGIVCTHNAEIKPLLKQLDRVRKYVDEGATFRGGFLDEFIRIAIVEAGPGFARHREITRTLIHEHHPSWVLSVGFSSALTADLNSGDVCLAHEICDTHGNSRTVKCPIPESKRVLVRKQVVADRHPRLRDERRSLAESTFAAAVDTTSLAVAQACEEFSEEQNDQLATRFLSIRSIVGGDDTDFAENVAKFLFEPALPPKPGGFGTLLQRIKPDPELAPWKKASRESADNLSRFVLSVIRQLGEKLPRSR